MPPDPPPPPGTFTPGPGTPRSDPRAQRRRVRSASALLTLLFGLPWLLCSLLIVSMAASLLLPPLLTFMDDSTAEAVAGPVSWVGAIGFLLSGGLVLWRPTEDVVARTVFRFRRPTPEEKQRINAVWGSVAQRAGVGPGEYSLWVEESDDINAFAGAGHTIAVTRHALTALSPQHLEAVLAHELGHHLGGHTWAGMMVYWYSLPTRMVLRIAGAVTGFMVWLYGAVIGAVAVFSPRNTGITAVVGCAILLVPFFCVLPFFLFLAPVLVAPPIEAWFRRRDELYADRVAARLGYGPALLDLFQSWQAQGHDNDYAQSGALARTMFSHPPVYARVQALHRHLSRGQA